MKKPLIVALLLALWSLSSVSSCLAQPMRANKSADNSRPYPELDHRYPRNHVWLVELKVLSAEPATETANATLVQFGITHVYSGHSTLLRQTFEQLMMDVEQTGTGKNIQLAPYIKDARFLCTVRMEPIDVLSKVARRFLIAKGYAIRSPQPLDGSPSAIEAEQHAKRIERVHNAPKSEREALMEEYAAGDFPITSTWAINSRAEITRPLDEVLLKHANKDRRRPYSEWGDIPYSAGSIWLVELKVLSAKPSTETDKETLVRFEIMHVYSGPSALLGRTFYLLYSAEDRHTADFQPVFYSNGERFISPVIFTSPDMGLQPHDRPKPAHRLYTFKGYSLRRPLLLDGSSSARQYEENAERIERVYNAPKNERKTLMQEYAAGSFPITTEWAISSIGWWPTPESREFLLKLSQSKQTVGELIALDRALESRDPNQWHASPERTALLTKIMGAPQTDGGTQALGIFGWGNFTPNLPFFAILADNPTVSQEVSNRAVSRPSNDIKQRGNQPTERAAAFTFWTDLLTRTQNLELATVIASQLAQNAPWTAEQNQQLEKLIRLVEQKFKDGKFAYEGEPEAVKSIKQAVKTPAK